jgi:hypothetical protein
MPRMRCIVQVSRGPRRNRFYLVPRVIQGVQRETVSLRMLRRRRYVGRTEFHTRLHIQSVSESTGRGTRLCQSTSKIGLDELFTLHRPQIFIATLDRRCSCAMHCIIFVSYARPNLWTSSNDGRPLILACRQVWGLLQPAREETGTRS